jgi:hypothetical protein
MDRRKGELQSWPGQYGKEKMLAPNRTRTPTKRSPESSQLLYQLRYPDFLFYKKVIQNVQKKLKNTIFNQLVRPQYPEI